MTLMSAASGSASGARIASLMSVAPPPLRGLVKHPELGAQQVVADVEIFPHLRAIQALELGVPNQHVDRVKFADQLERRREELDHALLLRGGGVEPIQRGAIVAAGHVVR